MKECFVYLLDTVHSSPWLDSIGECCLLVSVRDEHMFFFKQHLFKVEQWLIHLSRDVMVYFYQGQIYFGLMFKKTKNSCIHFQRFYTKHIENGDDTTPIFAPQWLAKACHRWSNGGGVQCPACACSDGESTIFTRVEVPISFSRLLIRASAAAKKNQKESIEKV